MLGLTNVVRILCGGVYGKTTGSVRSKLQSGLISYAKPTRSILSDTGTGLQNT